MKRFISGSILFSLVLLTPSLLALSYDLDTAKNIAQSKYWLRLLHYESSLFSKTGSSTVDGPSFFLSPDGKNNALSELTATIDAFDKDLKIGKLKQHPQCAFPERYRFLKERLHLVVKDVPCPELQAYMDKVKPSSVTLVFSSAYANNPGSMFGHTFLRINSSVNKKTAQEKQDLLDWGISYAAQVPQDENGLVFVFLGLSGGYPGQFSLLPYYAKVNEYNNSESRDIWEYELNINQEETERMVRHVWEIETNSHFDYYFLDENCALLLLSMLEIAKPEWALTHHFLYVIPGETVKTLTRIPGAVKNVKFRPSLRKRMLQKYHALTPEFKNRFWLVLNGEMDVKTIKEPSLLDTTATYLSYLKQKNTEGLSPSERTILHATLVQRSSLGKAEQTAVDMPRIDDSTRPDLGHDTLRVGVASGVETRNEGTGYFQDLYFKFPYHDLLNDDTGYVAFSQIDFPGMTLRYFSREKKIEVEQIHGLSISSLFPLSFIEVRPSWSFHLDYNSPKDLSCTHCHALHFDLGIGATVEIIPQKAIVYLLGYGQIEVASSLQRGYRLLPKIQLATLLSPLTHYKVQLAANTLFDLLQNERQKYFYQFELNQSYALSQSLELRANLLWLPLSNNFSSQKYSEAKLAINYYF